MGSPPDLTLGDGSRVGVVGGGPAGSFFAYFLLQMAERVGRELSVDLYEPKDFLCPGPKSCNMCGGIVSESLMQKLATEGIHLPPGVVQRRIDSYFLHMDVGSVRIATPMSEMRIAAVARGAGPRGHEQVESFDGFLLDMAQERGVHRISERIASVDVDGDRPRLRTVKGAVESYDLVVGAVGVNSPLLKTLEGLGDYRPPDRTKAYIAELPMSPALIDRYLESSMHVFLLNLPGLDFAALIPKSDFVTVCLLGDEIRSELVEAFLSSPEVRQVLPPHWEIPQTFCHCSPHLNVGDAVRPFGDRLVFVGDSGTTRLFKDGIGAAYRTAKVAARTAVFEGVGAADFERGYRPTCRAIHADNRLGRVVFSMTRQVQRRRLARRGLWRMTSREQKLTDEKRRMSMVLWDTFTGSAPYKSVMLRGLHPFFLGRLGWEVAAGLRAGDTVQPRESVPMASGVTGMVGRAYAAGQTIYAQGDPGDCMYVVHGGRVELVRREAGRELTLAVCGDGDFFGETAPFRARPRAATARALDDVGVVTLKRAELLRRVHEDPPMAFRLIERMAARIALLEEALVENARLPDEPWSLAPAPQRVELAPELGGGSPAASDAVRLTGRRYREGEVVYRQGDRGDTMYVIRSGAVEAGRRAGAREFWLPALGQGDFFGEMALFGAEVRSTTVRARRDSHIVTLERNALLGQIHDDPSTAFRLIENMADRIAGLEEAQVRFAPPPDARDRDQDRDRLVPAPRGGPGRTPAEPCPLPDGRPGASP